VDNVSVGAVTSYTFTNVQANHTIAATFAINTCTITATAGPNGTISPAGAVKVDWYADQVFTVAANAGYHVDSFKVDSANATLDPDGTHTFLNVEADHKIDVTFAANIILTTVTTDEANNITQTGATLNGKITDTGGENADARGFQYRKKGTSTWTESTESGSFAADSFKRDVSGLSAGTVYEFMAIAHNSAGGANGSTSTFTTVSPTPTVPPKSVITSISPTSGYVGSHVTIKGSKFGSSRGSSKVLFDSRSVQPYQIASWSDTRIVVHVPENVGSKVVVKVTTLGGTSKGLNFKVRPKIGSLSPTSGKKGTVVKITGNGFGGWDAGHTIVYFGGTPGAHYDHWSRNQINVKVPAHTAGKVEVKVVTDGGTSTTKSFNIKP
jgi:hypothetical protein